jgi:hypothetical protein
MQPDGLRRGRGMCRGMQLQFIRNGPRGRLSRRMLVSLIIVFREAMEAGLIVGIVLAATEGAPRRGRCIASGMVTGIVGASLVAVFAALSNAMRARVRCP